MQQSKSVIVNQSNDNNTDGGACRLSRELEDRKRTRKSENGNKPRKKPGESELPATDQRR